MIKHNIFKIEWRVGEETLTLFVKHPENDELFLVGFLYPKPPADDEGESGFFSLEVMSDSGMTLWDTLVNGDENDPGDKGVDDEPLLDLIATLEARTDERFIRRACAEYRLAHARAGAEVRQQALKQAERDNADFVACFEQAQAEAIKLGDVPGSTIALGDDEVAPGAVREAAPVDKGEGYKPDHISTEAAAS